jgi:gluconolactonase
MPFKPIALPDLERVGHGLKKPTGVAVDREGRLWVTDPDSAVLWLRPDGGVKRLGKAAGVPNGIAMDARDRVVIANSGLLAEGTGSLQRLHLASGEIETLCEALYGRALISSMHPAVAGDGTIYCAHASWISSLDEAIEARRDDGFIYLVDRKGQARMAARGLKFPSGCCLGYRDRYLFVAETLTAAVMRLEVMKDGSLGQAVPYGPPIGQIPDIAPMGGVERTARERARYGYVGGMGMDQDGNLWAVLPGARRVVVITPNLHLVVAIDDAEGKILKTPTTLAWGGPDLRDLYIGSVEADYVVKARSPVPGMPQAHQR